MRAFVWGLVVLLLAACRPAAPSVTNSNLIVWDHSPTTVVFRADIVGGQTDFIARNDVPNCTIYGDNRVVWVNELGASQIQVLEDRLPDQVISAYAQHLATDERIYTYDAHLADVQKQDGVDPVAEVVSINVDNLPHQADSFGGWDSDWFPRVLDACKVLSQTPILVAPSAGWLSAQSIPFSTNPPLATWDAQAMGISLSAAADGKTHWVSGAGTAALWTTIHSLPSDLIFQDGKAYFEVALQVPGITRDAPAAPSS